MWLPMQLRLGVRRASQVFMWHGSVIKCVSRQLNSKSLSSCEAELIASTIALQKTFELDKLFRFLESENPEIDLSNI